MATKLLLTRNSVQDKQTMISVSLPGTEIEFDNEKARGGGVIVDAPAGRSPMVPGDELAP